MTKYTYKGNNIGLGYDAATGTWGWSFTNTEYIDTNAFRGHLLTQILFILLPTDAPEDEEDFNPLSRRIYL